MRLRSDAKRNWIYCNSSGTFIREIKFKQPGQSSHRRRVRISRPSLSRYSSKRVRSKAREQRDSRLSLSLSRILVLIVRKIRECEHSQRWYRFRQVLDMIQVKLDQTRKLPKLREQATLRFPHRPSRDAKKAHVRCRDIFRPRQRQQLPISRRERSFADRESRERIPLVEPLLLPPFLPAFIADSSSRNGERTLLTCSGALAHHPPPCPVLSSIIDIFPRHPASRRLCERDKLGASWRGCSKGDARWMTVVGRGWFRWGLRHRDEYFSFPIARLAATRATIVLHSWHGCHRWYSSDDRSLSSMTIIVTAVTPLSIVVVASLACDLAATLRRSENAPRLFHFSFPSRDRELEFKH